MLLSCTLHALFPSTLGGQSLGGAGVMPICELYLLQPGMQPNQIVPCHHHSPKLICFLANFSNS